MTGTCAQLRLLLWKNWLLKKRRALSTVIEILIPVLGIAVLLLIRSLIHVKDVSQGLYLENAVSTRTNMTTVMGSYLCGSLFRHSIPQVGIAPTTPQDADIIKQLQGNVTLSLLSRLPDPFWLFCQGAAINVSQYVRHEMWREFPSEAAMQDYAQSKDYGMNDQNPPLALALVFGRPSPLQLAQHQWPYKIFSNWSYIGPTNLPTDKFVTDFDSGTWSQHFTSGVAPFKVFVDTFITQQLVTDQAQLADLPSDVTFVPFPMGAHKVDLFVTLLQNILGLFFTIIFTWPFSRLVRNLVDEKERRIREGAKMMGMRDSAFFMSWFFTYAIMLTIAAVLSVAISKSMLFPRADLSVVLIFFLAYSMALVSGGMLTSAFFSKAKTAGTMSFFLLLAAFLPYFAISSDDQSHQSKGMACLLAPIAFAQGLVQILTYESAFIGVSWSNLGEVENNFATATALAFLIFDSGLYLFLAWYIDQVWPGEYGTPRAWYFLCLPSYWCGNGATSSSSSSSSSGGLAAQPLTAVAAGHRGRGKRGKVDDLEEPLLVDPDSPVTGRKGYSSLQASSPLVTAKAGSRHRGSSAAVMYDQDTDASVNVEPVPAELRDRAGVSIRNLRKSFPAANEGILTWIADSCCGALRWCLCRPSRTAAGGAGRDDDGAAAEEEVDPAARETVAVKGLSLDMYDGQIFVLLGHNGAGKTTTLNMLTGLLSPTSGSATVSGHDLFADMEAVRQSMGVCPQHDVLWPELTVREHLIFFAALKGVPADQVPGAVGAAIDEVQLGPSASQPAGALSGGQRRRLSLAIALIGDPAVVFLDEPTSGVDPFSRRAIWSLLSRKKAGRVVVLTTHFMDEADQLGDRIAILHKGGLRCCGSSLFLKRIYGVGYTLTLSKYTDQNDLISAGPNDAESEAEEKSAADGSTQAIKELITHSVPRAELVSNVGSEVGFRLPLDCASQFPPLLRELDDRIKRQDRTLRVANYGLSVTTLEEVFLKVAHGEDENEKQQKVTKAAVRRISRAQSLRTLQQQQQQQQQQADVSEHTKLLVEPHGDEVHDPVLGAAAQLLAASHNHRGFGRDLSALLAKRWHISKRDRRATFFQLVIPLVLLVMGLSLLRIPPNFHFPPLLLSPQSQFPLPNYTPGNNGTNALESAYFSGMTSAEGTYQPLNADNLTQFSEAILNSRDAHVQSRYGGVYYRNSGSASQLAVYSNISANSGMGTFLGLASSLLLRQATNDRNAGILTTLQPFEFTYQEKTSINSVNGFFAAIVIALAFCFVPASFAVFVVKDRELNCKHLQRISGVNMFAYWLSAYIWDAVSFLISAALGAGIVYAFANPDFVGSNFPVVLITFALYGLAVIPFTYLICFLFVSHSTAQNVMIMIYLVGGIFMVIISFALTVISSTQQANKDYIRHLFRLVPNFCLGDTFLWLSIRQQPAVQLSQWDMDVSGYNFVFLTIEAIGYFALVLLVEYLSTLPHVVAWFRRDPAIPRAPAAEDVDVRNERVRIQNGGAGNDVITLAGLRKTYPPAKVALDELWFSVPAGQCFGFLGVNGAGKTTALKILTGDVLPTAGTAYLGGFNIVDQPAEVRRLMGYCPQFDALYEHLTAEETLQFYARIRGVPEQHLNAMVDFLIKRLTLTEYAHRPAGTYSGGNKRKLSVAMALIGNPRVVFLDEPSTGMDPVSRRFMWDFISETMASRAVILTTHSMEECEALCQRIGILALGDLKCLGSAHHLKQRFGLGYQVDVSTAENSTAAARAWILSTFAGAQEIESYGGNLKYRLPPQRGVSLADMFSLIEANRAHLGIAEYSVGQTSLEQIFIQFAKEGEAQQQQMMQQQHSYQHGDPHAGITVPGPRQPIGGGYGAVSSSVAPLGAQPNAAFSPYQAL